MATEQLDIQLSHIDALNDDVNIANGDFVISESTLEHQRQLIYNNKGDYKQNPTICLGLVNYLEDEDTFKSLERDAAKELARDGMTVNQMKILPDGSLGIDAYYP